MCDHCRQNSPNASGFTRRTLLALIASAVGGLTLGFLSCHEKPEKPPPTTSEPSAAQGPAPDLGSEVFPDAAGNALARPSDAPVIILPRSDWTHARPNLTDIRLMNGVNRLTVHHTGWQVTSDAWTPTVGELENIREFHSGTRPADRKWADIAYHFVVDRAGRVWQARPLAYQGAHVHLQNEHNLGIVLLGNFDTQYPSAAQLVALSGFIGFVRRLYSIPVSRIYTHGELGQTSCPGKQLQAFMNRARQQWAAEEAATLPAAPSTTSPSTLP